MNTRDIARVERAHEALVAIVWDMDVSDPGERAVRLRALDAMDAVLDVGLAVEQA